MLEKRLMFVIGFGLGAGIVHLHSLKEHYASSKNGITNKKDKSSANIEQMVKDFIEEIKNLDLTKVSSKANKILADIKNKASSLG